MISNRFISFILMTGLLAGGFADTSASQAGKTPSFEDILNLASPGSPMISPDGRAVLYTVSRPDWEDNEHKTQIWLADVRTGENRQLTFHKKPSSNPQWSPDGNFISFTSNRDKENQIYLMSAAGGEARPLSDVKTGISGYNWSPDGRRIAYTAADERSKKDEDLEKKFGKFEIVDESVNVNHLWLLDVATGKSDKLVNDENLQINAFSWSPDGATIAFSGTLRPLSRYSDPPFQPDIYTVRIADKFVQRIVDMKGPDASPVWSPDGSAIAFSSSMGKEQSFLNTRISVIPAGGGAVTLLTLDFDENASPLIWTGDGIYFNALQGMSSHLFRIDRASGKVTRITQGEGWIGRGFSFSREGKTIAFSFVDASHSPDIYVSHTDSFSPKKLTNFSEQIKDWRLGVKEPVKWKSKDGAEITGVLIKPADFDPAKKYPLFVIIHGGPSATSFPQLLDGNNRTYPVEQWLAKGAVILEPNYRGSAGFGEAFRKLNYRNLGVGDYWDIISGVDYLVSKDFVDNGKVAAMGWSQGGYISAFITTFSQRFKAVSVGAGISDWMTYYVNTDIHPFTRTYLGATPWDDRKIYEKTSPMTYIKTAKTPTLIQHGENDARVPIPNAYELYQGLRDKSVPVRLIVYKGFGHGINKPKENLACLTHNFEWFNKYIWGEESKADKGAEEKESTNNPIYE